MGWADGNKECTERQDKMAGRPVGHVVTKITSVVTTKIIQNTADTPA